MSSRSPLRPTTFAALDGWRADALEAAWPAFLRSCREIVEAGRAFARPSSLGGARVDWLGVCEAAITAGARLSGGEARAFFERHFRPFAVDGPDGPEGLFTGYYEPEALGSRRSTDVFDVPVYARPPELVPLDDAAARRLGLRYGRIVDGAPAPFLTRREIEEGGLAGRGLELLWLSSWADAFFIHVQGSGRVRLPDGEIVRLAFAAKNGLPYTAIGGILVKRGEIALADNSMQAIRRWMALHPEAVRALMWENDSFVFFREVEAVDGLGPPGAQLVGLTPGRSLAVDRGIWAFGTPLWVDTRVPIGDLNDTEPFRRLMIAQDTGSAIKGHVRGDIFFGAGEAAAMSAGRMKGRGRMVALLPLPLAERLAAEP
jgi:membrane-bound lytic murein transglycosylase A